ncbi:MAG: transcriptional regulator, partial [Candidatus Limnocylindria bacterium]
MIEWKLTPQDVARIRFAISPLLELVLSLVVLRAPERHSLHLRWVRWALPRLTGLDLAELFALTPVRGITADFLTPPPMSPLPDIAAQLDIVRHTPGDRVLIDLVDVPGVPEPVLKRIRDDPAGATGRLADALRACWDRVLAEHWPRIQAQLDADVLW